MTQLCKADAELAARFKEDNKCWSSKCTDWDSLFKKYNDTNVSYIGCQGALKAVQESGEDSDNFTTQNISDLKVIRSQLDDFSAQT